MRFGVLGTGFWAREAHAASLAAHPTAQLAGFWGRDQAKVEAAGAEFDVPGTTELEALLAEVDAVSFALPPDVQAPLAERAAAAGKHLLLEKPVALSTDAADRVVAAVEAAGVASVVFFTSRFRTATATWLEQASRAPLAGGAVTWLGRLAGSPFETPWRLQHGGLWDVGPHALSLLVPALGPVTAVQAGGGQGDTVHLVLFHVGGRASTVTVSTTVAELATGVDVWVHGDAGRLVLLPEHDPDAAVAAHQVAVDELAAAALIGGVHPCDVHFGRDVVRVLEAAQRALDTGCREPVHP
jgi:predicted dehydrogenase